MERNAVGTGADDDRRFRGFLRTYLELEQAYDTGWDLRGTLFSFRPEYAESVRRGFEELLRDRVDVGAYERLTNLEFPDEDTLHHYLRAVYAYLFAGADGWPAPPDSC
ncbi:hypothetical protein OOK31_07280 [Streptomyces sp. NBC_00249]|uniref:hypothetical protein n=1 Tax=Streptomyces sp. NBC_00249 TaxID=2975690 RepID=UPI00225A3822|nr:hypothetical protein [Streptomyces sp. NBC_00249]MCX5193695.1 hypothetical protein [Streptomyces sp. NBC_00249]